MHLRRTVLTAVIAVVVGVSCLLTTVKDGGNVDFYWKPMLAIWFLCTVTAFVPLRKKASVAWLRDSWWLQLVVPIILFGKA
jgi:hypothetical protein